MSGVSLTAKVKVAGSPLTLAALEDARDNLRGIGAPSHATLKVAHYAQSGWEIVAIWSPVDPASLAEPAEVIAERIRKDHGHNQVQL